MDEFRTFEGKSIDDAIAQALKFFDVSRSQLEIDILSDAKSGIFGLVGARKAQVKARRRESARKQVAALAQTGRPLVEGGTQGAPVAAKQRVPKEKPRPVASPAAEPEAETPAAEAAPASSRQLPPEEPAPTTPRRGREMPRSSQAATKSAADARAREASVAADAERPGLANADGVDASDSPAAPQSQRPAPEATHSEVPHAEEPNALAMDIAQHEAIVGMVQDMMEQLLTPLVGEPVLQISMPEPGKILVGIDAGEDAGLLIGKEGSTLSALQYLANRIIAKQLMKQCTHRDTGTSETSEEFAEDGICDASVPRISLEAGDYKERQDDGLRQLAFSLADKVKQTGKAQSTRPLSSYHRRVVHLALQEDDTLVTRSKGEGALKRVVVMPKRGKGKSTPKESGQGRGPRQDANAPPAEAMGSDEKKPRRPRRPRRRRGAGKPQGEGSPGQADESQTSQPVADRDASGQGDSWQGNSGQSSPGPDSDI